MASFTSFHLLARTAKFSTTTRIPLLSRKLSLNAHRFYCVVSSPVTNVRPWVKHAFIFGVVVAGSKAALADILVQTRIENSPSIDWRRVKIFCTFGAIFCGMWQYFLYNKMFPLIVPGIDHFLALPIRARFRDVQGLKGVAIQCSIENFFNNTFCYFPVFYTVKLFLEGSESLNPMIGIRRYYQTWREDLWNTLKIWIPAQTFNFFFCPIWARVSFTALVSFGFTAYISFLRGAPDEVIEKDAPEMLRKQMETIVPAIGEAYELAGEVSENMSLQIDAAFNEPIKQNT